MNDPNKPDSPSESRPPEGSSSDRPYISARLREKLEESGDDDWQPKSGSPITAIIVGLVVLAVVIGGVMYLGSAAKAQKAKEAAAAAAQARADSLASIAQAESLAVAAHADSLARAAADSVARKQGKLPKSGATASGTPSGGGAKAGGSTAGASGGGAAGGASGGGTPAPATDGFGIAVGTYLDEARAKSEADRLSGTTSLAGMVAPTSDGSFRVILGKFSSRGAADRKATALADSGLVREAHVVARPK